MLALTRQRGQQIVVVVPEDAKPGDRIVFEIVDVRGDKIRCGIQAPKTYTIHRKEIQDTIDSGVYDEQMNLSN